MSEESAKDQPKTLEVTNEYAQELLQRLDLGMLVIDKDYNVQFWNRFMVLYSGIASEEICGKKLFDFFPEIPEKWFRKKIESVFLLKTNSFITWEQRQYLFKFRHSRPITGGTEFMAQNITIFPIKQGKKVDQVAVSIFDVTDVFIYRTQLEEANIKLENLSQTDRLTGVYNRGHFEELLKNEYNRSQRHHQPLSLLMLDIDHFKRINDTKGHLAGDAVIKGLAQAVSTNIRGHDVIGRYGGEEFCVFLPSTGYEGAMGCAEKIRQIVEAMIVPFEEDEIRITTSVGVAVLNENMYSYEKLLQAADSALYISKNKGRNAVSDMFEVQAQDLPKNSEH